MAEGDEGSLPELIVKEVVGAGLDSSMRESILEAVEDAEGPQQGRTLPVAVAAFALGTGIGYVLGSTEEPPIEPDAESLPIEEESIPSTPMESSAEEETDSGGSRLPRLLLALAVTGGIAYIQYRRRQDEEGWEPIDEVDKSLEDASEVVEGIAEEATEAEEESEEETESAEGEAESETDEADETDEE